MDLRVEWLAPAVPVPEHSVDLSSADAAGQHCIATSQVGHGVGARQAAGGAGAAACQV